MIERILIGLLSRRPRAARGRAGPGQDADRPDPRRRRSAPSSSASSSRPTCCPADLVGTMIYNQQTGEFTVRHGPIFANLVLADEINRAPAKVQSALLEAMQERQVTIGEHDLPAAGPVPGPGHAEPHRAGGHLPAARGAGRPLHAQGEGRLPDPGRGAGHHGPHGRRRASPAPRRSSARSRLPAPARWSTRSTSTTRSRTTSSTWSSPRASPSSYGLKDLADSIEYRRQPARDDLPGPGGAGARLPAPPRLRHARGREGRRPRRAAPPRHAHLRGRGRGGHAGADRPAGLRHASRFRSRTRRCCPGSSSGASAGSRSPPARSSPTLLAGQYHSVFKGRGMAFSEVRPYQPGDDIRSIDWNVTARMNDAVRQGLHRGARADRDAAGGRLGLGGVRLAGDDGRRRWPPRWRR